MLIINIGMPRSGTLWRYRIIRDLVVEAGGTDGSIIRKRYLLHPFYKDLNSHIDTLSVRRLPISTVPSLLGETYVLNTHDRPTNFVRRGIQKGWIKAIYGYRDPRDCILSMMDYSRKKNPKYHSANFKDLNTVQQAADYMKLYIEIWKAWQETPGTHLVRYEDQLVDFQTFVDQIVSYLNLKLSDSQVQEITTKYLPKQPAVEGSKIHFSKGIAQRFRTDLPEEDQAYLAEIFGPDLDEMGYTI